MKSKNNIQEIRPDRTCKETYKNYPSFKPCLRDDFNKRCGYCDCDDFQVGGSRGFQIDHFKPKAQFPDLENDYENLVYSCPYCNRAKWNKWEDVDGFVDPCTIEYDDHLYRNNLGQIYYHTVRGQYIFEELKLGLERHEILWMMRKLEAQRDALSDHLKSLGKGHEKEVETMRLFIDIQNHVSQYTKLFRDSI